MNKKTLFLIPMTALLSIGTFACSSSSGGSSGTSETDSTSEINSTTETDTGSVTTDETPVTIKFTNAFGQSYQTQIDKWIAEFEELYPYITVENDWISGSYDTIHSNTVSDIAANTGEYGDLVVCYPDHVVDYINYGKAVKLDDLMNNSEFGWTSEDFEDVISAFLEEGQKFVIDGTYTVPFSKSTEGLWYNADVLIGLDLSAYDEVVNPEGDDHKINDGNPLTEEYISNLTWEELFDYLCPAIMAYNDAQDSSHKIIEEDDSGMYGVLGYDSTANLFINLCEQYGYGYTSINTQTGVASLDFSVDGQYYDEIVELLLKFNDASVKHYITPSSRVANNNYCSSYFKDQNFLFNIGSTAGVTNYPNSNFDVNITNIPGAAVENTVNNGATAKNVISQGPSLCILSHGDTNRSNAAWLFYKFLTTTYNSALWAVTVGYMPIRTSSLSTEIYLEYADTTGKDSKSQELLVAKDAIYSSNATNYAYTSSVFTGSSTARTQVGAVMASVLADSTLTKSEIEAIIAEAVNSIKLDM